jgi:hypothetical protein
MWRLLEFMTSFYWLLIPQFIVENLWHMRRQNTFESADPWQNLGRGIKGAMGLYTAEFYVDRSGPWSGRRIKRLLAAYDIPMWGWGFAFGQFYFHVPLEDAHVAEQILLAAGVDLVG